MIFRILDVFRGPEGHQGWGGQRGEPGPRGHKGDPGTIGKPGPRGESFDHIQTIKLPVHVITVTNNWHDIVNTRRRMRLVKAFFLGLQIDIQDSHSAKHRAASLSYEDDSLGDWHYYNVHGPALTLYVDPNVPSVGLGYMGQVSGTLGPYGTAIIAGDHGDAYTATIIEHELGHLLGLDHEQETFMSASIRDTSPVTKGQREALRVGAYEWGSY